MDFHFVGKSTVSWRYMRLSCEVTWIDLVAALRSPDIGLMELASSVERIFKGCLFLYFELLLLLITVYTTS